MAKSLTGVVSSDLADKTITVTNSRTAPTPTGLLLDAAPYGTMLLAAGTGSVLLLRKRRNSDE